MANRPSTRKRVNAIRRGPDGSAFEKCRICELSVAIALADMHECGESVKDVKRFRGISWKSQTVVKQNFLDQPRSAFRFFMEEFVKTCKSVDPIDVDREGFETWKKMNKEEREPYVAQASKVNLAYCKALFREEKDLPEVNGEADSTTVGKFDPFEDYSGSGWHTYVEGHEGDNDERIGKFDPFEDCSGSGWHFYVEGDEDDDGSSDGSGWHTYVPNGA
ncbi:hypothetical protein FEM48_Zijuj03G0115300 [Ziziphus jujuba var. spinosa]|uniref:High mobility group B protein 7 n=1 Tax=Ziziphus jujuba var. spinosa TaxID=714518 RepID=A0A978VQ25_ZIZJJ|nr:hypothetical protein FEM48_Zijuj03G0115300 [Ziziphus jujuba var. spinosa]